MQTEKQVKPVLLPYFFALIAAVLFGISTPFSKTLLADITPAVLAGLAYTGSGFGMLILLIFLKATKNKLVTHAALPKGEDLKWMAGIIIAGGFAAPLFLMFGLKATPSATASLLLNFESVATAVLAAFFFKEKVSQRTWISIGIITLATIILSLDTSAKWGFSLGAIAILAACLCWGIDNNCTNRVSANNPIVTVMLKGIFAGLFSLGLATLILKNKLPSVPAMFKALMLGFVSYGLSIAFFILAMRKLGAARTTTIFASAPFLGVIISVSFLGESPDLKFLISTFMMLAGIALLVTEKKK